MISKANWMGGGLQTITASEKQGKTSMISAKIIKHSINYTRKPLITYVLEYPRYIHSELMTHRVFSKNSASSRAIPFEKFVKMVQDKPVKPLWTLNQSGMQGPVITDPGSISGCDRVWLAAREDAIKHAKVLHYSEGIHKQNINRLLEPWMHIKIVLTGSDFTNWFELRDHKDAHPEIQELARMMRFAFEASTPQFLQPGEWHIPFDENVVVNDEAHLLYGEKWKLKCSVARCARVSYNNFDGVSTPEKDLELYEKLVVSRPLHASPAEHQARVPLPDELVHMRSGWHYGSQPGEDKEEWYELRGKYFSNLSGWIQLRKLIECGEFK